MAGFEFALQGLPVMSAAEAIAALPSMPIGGLLLELVDGIPGVAGILDGVGAPVVFNRRFYDFAGPLTAEDILIDERLYHPDDIPELGGVRIMINKSPRAMAVEVRLCRWDHSYRWHRVDFTPLFLGRPAPVGYLVCATEISPKWAA